MRKVIVQEFLDQEDVEGMIGDAIEGITKETVGLDQVDNTSDMDKPVSTATASELAGKADIGHDHIVDDIGGLTDELAGKADVGHSHEADDVSGLRGELDGKADEVHTHTPSDIEFSGGFEINDEEDTVHIGYPNNGPELVIGDGSAVLSGGTSSPYIAIHSGSILVSGSNISLFSPNAPTNNAHLTRKDYVDNQVATRVASLVAGDNISIDDTDPANPVVSASGGGGAVDSGGTTLRLRNASGDLVSISVDASNNIVVTPVV